MSWLLGSSRWNGLAIIVFVLPGLESAVFCVLSVAEYYRAIHPSHRDDRPRITRRLFSLPFFIAFLFLRPTFRLLNNSFSRALQRENHQTRRCCCTRVRMLQLVEHAATLINFFKYLSLCRSAAWVISAAFWATEAVGDAVGGTGPVTRRPECLTIACIILSKPEISHSSPH